MLAFGRIDLVSDTPLTESGRSISAKVRYINSEWKVREDSPRIGSRESRRAVTSFQDVEIHDARPLVDAGTVDLDTSGFTLTKNDSSVGNFRNNDEVTETYYPEMMALIRRVTGAKHAFVLHHLVRTETPTSFNDGYARFVHCDYNIKRIYQMSEDLLKKNKVRAQENWSYVWCNTWQPFDNVVENNPLALMDWESLPFDDVIDYYYTGNGGDNLVAAPIYNPAHKLYYFPSMSTNEVIVTKQLDSRPGHSVYCPHTSFDDQTAVDGSLPRRSIETRLLAVFENG